MSYSAKKRCQPTRRPAAALLLAVDHQPDAGQGLVCDANAECPKFLKTLEIWRNVEDDENVMRPLIICEKESGWSIAADPYSVRSDV